ncbi:MAG TPA: serine hydrolase domain-containing protein [Steroidobacteraceae bacterium]|nr:serine hydrolase domain-containing protein [Steroidobacteraceae bacterium]
MVTRRACLTGCGALAIAGPARIWGMDRTQAGSERAPAGLELARIRALEAQFEGASLLERMARHRVPGVSIAVTLAGRTAWAKGYGLREAGTTFAVTPDTRFQAASISKPVAALATLKLVDQGLLDLDADVNKYLRQWTLPASPFTAEGPVTLRHIMSHSAGLSVHGFSGYPPGVTLPSVPQILDGVPPANSPPVRSVEAPGVRTEYSGGGIMIEQLAVMDVTGRDYGRLLTESVLHPLGMEHSSYAQPPSSSMAAAAATAHDEAGNPIRGHWHVYPEQAAAGLWTTPRDLARYIIAVQAAVAGEMHAVISRPLARQMVTPQLDDAGEMHFGLGPEVDGARFRHGGSNEGFRCQFAAAIDGAFGAVVMTNGAQGGELIKEIFPIIEKTLG